MVEIGVQRWVSEMRFTPKFLLSAGAFLVLYFFMSFVVRDPIPVIDEIAVSLGGAIAVYIIMGRRDMRSDMAGAATVLGTIKAASELGLKRHVVGIIPACENLLGSKAFKQGDILTAYNGKTIEVHHTDAEGRLILADGLSYAEKHFKAKAIIDIATLTGASIIALGFEITSMMSFDDALKKKLLDAAEKTDDEEGKHWVTWVQATATVEPESWVIRGQEDDELLRHEQGHFDIVALSMREAAYLTSKLKGNSAGDLEKQKTAITAKFEKSMQAVSARYDEQTDHSRKAAAQRRWLRSIRKAKKKATGRLSDLPD